VSKRPRASASQGEPSLKKIRKGSEATVSAQIPEVLPSGMEEQEEDEKEAASSLCPLGRAAGALQFDGSRACKLGRIIRMSDGEGRS